MMRRVAFRAVFERPASDKIVRRPGYEQVRRCVSKLFDCPLHAFSLRCHVSELHRRPDAAALSQRDSACDLERRPMTEHDRMVFDSARCRAAVGLCCEALAMLAFRGGRHLAFCTISRCEQEFDRQSLPSPGVRHVSRRERGFSPLVAFKIGREFRTSFVLERGCGLLTGAFYVSECGF